MENKKPSPIVLGRAKRRAATADGCDGVESSSGRTGFMLAIGSQVIMSTVIAQLGGGITGFGPFSDVPSTEESVNCPELLYDFLIEDRAGG